MTSAFEPKRTDKAYIRASGCDLLRPSTSFRSLLRTQRKEKLTVDGSLSDNQLQEGGESSVYITDCTFSQPQMTTADTPTIVLPLVK